MSIDRKAIEQRVAELRRRAGAPPLTPRATNDASTAAMLDALLREIDRLTALADLRGQTVADLADELGTVKAVRDQLRDALAIEVQR